MKNALLITATVTVAVIAVLTTSGVLSEEIQEEKTQSYVRVARELIDMKMYEQARKVLLEAKDLGVLGAEIDTLLKEVSSELAQAKKDVERDAAKGNEVRAKNSNAKAKPIDSRNLERVFSEVNFKDAQLEEIVTYLSAKSDVNIIISKQAREILDPKPSPPEMGIFGVKEEGDEDIDNSPRLIDNGGITIRLKNVPLKAVLKYVLRTKGLKYIVEDYAIVIVPEGHEPYEEMETEIIHLYKSGEGITNVLRRGF